MTATSDKLELMGMWSDAVSVFNGLVQTVKGQGIGRFFVTVAFKYVFFLN